MFKMNSSSDGFTTSIESEKYGKLTLESKFSEDGCMLVSHLILLIFQSQIYSSHVNSFSSLVPQNLKVPPIL